MFDSLKVVGVAFVNDETLQPLWEALQATYAAEPFAAPIPIIACLPKSARKEPRYAAMR
jgi:hypothetical protein